MLGKVSMFAPSARYMETAAKETTFGSIIAAAFYKHVTSNKVMLRLFILADSCKMKRLRTLACAVLLTRVSSLRTFSVEPALRDEII